jgi:murein DD-endopeptidase MepM/ murein hydrolase activator NlpD
MIAAWSLTLTLALCLPPPVTAPISEPYVAPACEYCAGHRGVGFEVPAGTPVTAVDGGTVTFAGGVAGVRYVVVQHADGRRATYGLLRAVSVRQGQQVQRSQTLGFSSTRVHFGLRDGDRYLDPTPELGRWLSRPRLVPLDGTRRRASPPARLVCRSSG